MLGKIWIARWEISLGITLSRFWIEDISCGASFLKIGENVPKFKNQVLMVAERSKSVFKVFLRWENAFTVIVVMPFSSKWPNLNWFCAVNQKLGKNKPKLVLLSDKRTSKKGHSKQFCESQLAKKKN